MKRDGGYVKGRPKKTSIGHGQHSRPKKTKKKYRGQGK
jgi:hypothetical protein